MLTDLIKIYAFNGHAAVVEIDEANGAIKITGNASSTSAGKLVYATGGFTAAVDVGDEVYNSTDQTHAFVTAVDSDTQLSLSADIFVSGETFQVQGEATHNIGDTDMGSTDAANLDPVANPIIAGENSFQKYQKMHVTDIDTSSLIDNFKVWRTGALGGAALHKTDARIAGYVRKPYVAPTASATSAADQTMPTAEPASSNLGIDGSLTGSIATAGFNANKAFSDLLVHQIQTNAADVAGSTSTMNYQYDETA